MWSWRKCSSNSKMPLQSSVTFTLLAHTYYAAVLSHGNVYTSFPQRYNVPWLECSCGAADWILPCPEGCTFAFSYASCWYSPAQREFFTCWYCCFSWAFPSSSSRNYPEVTSCHPISLDFRNWFPHLLCANQPYFQEKSLWLVEDALKIGEKCNRSFLLKVFLNEKKNPFRRSAI